MIMFDFIGAVFNVAAYSIQCSTWSYLTLEADFYFADFSTVVPYEKMHQVKDSVMQHQ